MSSPASLRPTGTRRYGWRRAAFPPGDSRAEDAAALAFADLWEECHDVAPADWSRNLGGHVRHRVYEMQRRKRPAPVDPGELANVAGAAVVGDDDTQELVREVLSRLRPADRQVLVLHDAEGWSHGKLAAANGWSDEAQRQRVRRARERFRAMWAAMNRPGAPAAVLVRWWRRLEATGPEAVARFGLGATAAVLATVAAAVVVGHDGNRHGRIVVVADAARPRPIEPVSHRPVPVGRPTTPTVTRPAVHAVPITPTRERTPAAVLPRTTVEAAGAGADVDPTCDGTAWRAGAYAPRKASWLWSGHLCNDPRVRVPEVVPTPTPDVDGPGVP